MDSRITFCMTKNEKLKGKTACHSYISYMSRIVPELARRRVFVRQGLGYVWNGYRVTGMGNNLRPLLQVTDAVSNSLVFVWYSSEKISGSQQVSTRDQILHGWWTTLVCLGLTASFSSLIRAKMFEYHLCPELWIFCCTTWHLLVQPMIERNPEISSNNEWGSESSKSGNTTSSSQLQYIPKLIPPKPAMVFSTRVMLCPYAYLVWLLELNCGSKLLLIF